MDSTDKFYAILVSLLLLMVIAIFIDFFFFYESSEEKLKQMVNENVCSPNKIVSTDLSQSETAIITCSDGQVITRD